MVCKEAVEQSLFMFRDLVLIGFVKMFKDLPQMFEAWASDAEALQLLNKQP